MTEFVGETQTIDFADPKTKILADIFCKEQDSIPKRLLVVGCRKKGFKYCFYAFEHFSDFRAVLTKLPQILCPESRWIIGTLNRKWQ